MAMEVFAAEQKPSQDLCRPRQLQSRHGRAAGQYLSRIAHWAGIDGVAGLPLRIKAVNAAAPDAGELVGDPLNAAKSGGPFPQQLQDCLAHRRAVLLHELEFFRPRSTAYTTGQNTPHRFQSGCRA